MCNHSHRSKGFNDLAAGLHGTIEKISPALQSIENFCRTGGSSPARRFFCRLLYRAFILCAVRVYEKQPAKTRNFPVFCKESVIGFYYRKMCAII